MSYLLDVNVLVALGWLGHSHKHTTDSHLLALAGKHGLKLATLDTGIPGAFLIP